ncbi:class IV lanthionine synthetase LanL [Actinomadura verrucosospora]|uniref:class IV lanthionine synthetase LanL n=1 Tax=Actinomadura verrucosospora TaxID=46165 RepID=UPI001FEC1CB7|nr:class IV lanthionine synthetase LanL [Actinomadura verrucosospora]
MVGEFGWRTRAGRVWVHCDPPSVSLPEQGWKIHVSARPATLPETLRVVVPLLVRRGCAFKVVNGREALAELNAPDDRVSSVGKAITAYPSPELFRELAVELAEALRGFAAPVVRSDRRVHPEAPVYYRYGPFAARYRVSLNGQPELVVTGPDGEEYPGAAGRFFGCPPWERDPLSADQGPPPDDGEGPPPDADEVTPVGKGAPVGDGDPGVVLGGRWRLQEGVQNRSRGRIFRGRDVVTGREVVVKEARAYIGGETADSDCRANLRSERRVLAALDGVTGVPQVLDHFRHGEDEFLVLSSMGRRNLADDVATSGIYPDRPGERDLSVLARELLVLLDAVHERGVVVRDLSPKNVVLDEAGGCHLIDFELARLDGRQRPGYSRGYCSPEQLRGEPGTVADDHFAVGMTLFYAATGIDPVMIHRDALRDAEQSLAVLAGAFPDGGPTLARIPGLVSADPAERIAAVGALRAGDSGRFTGWSHHPAEVDTGTVARVLTHTLAQTVRHGKELLTSDSPSGPMRLDVWQGAAGLGTELLHHLTDGTAQALAADLARNTAEHPLLNAYPQGLAFGRTGIAVFLAAAGRRLDDDDLRGAARRAAPPDPGLLARVEYSDYAQGLAGIGAGHLMLAELTGDGAHLAVAAECARRIADGECLTSADDTADPTNGIVIGLGHAHGRAGLGAFLLAYHTVTGDRRAEAAAHVQYAVLCERLPQVLAAAARPSARPMCASWCQGLSGIGTSLLRAAALGDDRCLRLAQDAAETSLLMAPRMGIVTQCCGMAGVGELLVDLGAATGQNTWFGEAERVLGLMLDRCGGEPDTPAEFPDNSLRGGSGGWATGSAGILTLLRRVRDRGGAGPWTFGQWTAA